ncbi:MAG: lipopolysaccharide biosynthesis protein [Prevotellaceae bacterium]|jgi:O-antigen/teichoic acid export membrane protein|nr:lipopolysaccharide biosynthesis protein [Prevotellaceae bacterium]
MASLREKTVSGFLWNFIELISSQIINFIGTWFLARYFLSPEDYGLIGYTVIFTSLAQVFIDSGFSQALIRKQDCSEADYNTVFYVNILLGVFLYGLLFLFAPVIANYYQEPSLVKIIRVIAVILPLNALILVHRTILIKQLDFKRHAIIGITGAFCGFAVAVAMAFNGFTVWSLVGKSVVTYGVLMLLFWIFGVWHPKRMFSIESVKTLLGFGSKLLLIYTMATLFKSIYNSVIGKNYGKQEFGFYTNADTISSVPAAVITALINKVAYSALSGFQTNTPQLKEHLRTLMRPILLVSFTGLLTLTVVGEPFLILMLTDKWAGTVFFFQVLCVAYMAHILHAENQIVMTILGRSDYFLWTEIIKYLLFIPVIFIGLSCGIRVLVIAYAVHCWVGFLLNAMFTKRLIDYGLKEQLLDLLVPMGIALAVAAATVFAGWLMQDASLWMLLIVQLLVAAVMAILITRIAKVRAYRELKSLIVSFVKRK